MVLAAAMRGEKRSGDLSDLFYRKLSSVIFRQSVTDSAKLTPSSQ
jgi:hypothetical protein